MVVGSIISIIFTYYCDENKRNKVKLSVWLREVSGAKTVPKNHANINKTGKSNENMRISAIESIGDIQKKRYSDIVRVVEQKVLAVLLQSLSN